MTLTTWSRALGMASRGVAGATLMLVIAACESGPASDATSGAAEHNKSRVEKEKEAILAQQQQKDEEAKKLQAQLKEQSAKIERLLADLTSAKSDAERAAIQKQLEEAQDAKNVLMGRPKKSPAPACKCQPGDPLCSCL